MSALTDTGHPAPVPLLWKQWLLIGCIFISAIFLRTHKLGEYPLRFETADEYHYVWCGLNLLDHGAPAAWSNLAIYQKLGRVVAVPWKGEMLSMAEPALDHPPLFSVLAGLYVKLLSPEKVVVEGLSGRAAVYDYSLGHARLLSIVLFAVSFWLLFFLVREIHGFGAAAVASLLLSVLAHSVMHSRLIVTEALTTPLLLGGVWACVVYARGRMRESSFAAIAIVTSMMAVLCKLVASTHAGVLIVLLLLLRKNRAAFYPLAGLVAGVLLSR